MKKTRYRSQPTTAKQITFLICILLQSIFVSALPRPPQAIVSGQPAPSEQFRDLDALIRHYRFYKPDSALYFIRKGMVACESARDYSCLGEMHNHLGIIYENRGKLDSARACYQQSIAAFRRARNLKGISNELNRLGVIELRQSKYPQAASHFYTALKGYEQERFLPGIAECYLKLGALYDRQQQYGKAIGYIRKAENVVSGLPFSANTLYVYSGLGNAHFKQENYIEAAEYYKTGMQQSTDPQYRSLHLSMSAGLASCLARLGQGKKALSILRGALPISISTRLYDREIQILSALGDAHIQKHPDSAAYYYKQAVEKSASRGDAETAIRNLKYLQELYHGRGNYRDALRAASRERQMSDSLFNLQKSLQIADLEANHDLRRANLDIQTLRLRENAQRTERYAVIAVCVLVIAFLIALSIFYLRQQQLNRQLQAANGTLSLLISELEQANQAKDKIFSVIGHDLRSPLATIIGVLELFGADLLEPDERKEIAKKLSRQSTATIELLDNLLRWGQGQLQGLQTIKREIELSELVDRNIELLDLQAQQKSIAFRSELQAPLKVYADPSHVDFVLRNLLSNAIKYSYRSGTITIGSVPDLHEGQHAIFVRDNGMGMEGETVERVFRLDGQSRAGTGGEKGTGLGLVICKSFIEANGGRITVESIPKLGATFTFSLPQQH